MSIQQSGVLKRIVGSPSERYRERRRPFSPIGPRIRPSTMAALLNSLQMGFKTLAIQKRSGEVWQLLGAVKTEFDKFGQGLSKMQQRLRQTDEELDNLIGVRSRAISRKLRAVQTLDENTAATLLELDTEPGRPVTARLPESGEEL